MILAHGTGALDYQILDEDPSSDRVVGTLRRLLEARGQEIAIALLDAAPFAVFEGTNDFNDDFSVLYALLPVEAYERVRERSEFRQAAREIQRVLEELHVYARFVVVDVEHEVANWSPDGYECEREPFASGGYADVFRARHLQSSRTVALKRLRNDDTKEATARLRREIQEQSRIEHANVMPILDHDRDFKWFTMPLADGSLVDLREKLSEEEITGMLKQVSGGLDAAHALGLVHRDITPRNILRLTTEEGSQWVVSDWGLVRRPRGLTSTIRTFPGQPFGTEGFVAPEVANDGHEADVRADVYSLGRVLGFVVTGDVPRPNLSQDVEGHWRYLVQRLTHSNPVRRIQSMAELQATLTAGFGQARRSTSKTATELAAELADGVDQGRPDAVDSLVDLALANRDDADLWLDHVAHMSREAAAYIVTNRTDSAETLLEALFDHLSNNWNGRGFNEMNTPLERFLWIAEEAAWQERWGLLEDAARMLFNAEVHCKRFAQRNRTRTWLIGLDGKRAEIVGRALASAPRAPEWYLEEGWRATGVDPAIRAALK